MPAIYISSAGNVRWRATWRDADGTQRSRNFGTEKEARDYELAQKISQGHTCALDGCDQLIVRRGQRFCRQEHKQKFNNDKRKGSRRRPAPELREPVVCKLPECTNLVPQNPTGRPGEFCCREHGTKFWNRQASKSKGAATRHRVTGVDSDTRMGFCSVCGPVRAWKFEDKYVDGSPRSRWRCPNRVKATRSPYVGNRERWYAKTKGRYGLDPAQVDALVVAHQGYCGSCGGQMRASLHFDHDHTTNELRGLLCATCNTGIGKLGDTIEGLRSALAYLENPPARTVLSAQQGDPLSKE